MFMRYLRRLFAMRRLEPRDDLTTALVQAEEAGDHLSADELLSMVFLLLVAGHETTVNLIASGTLALLEQPDQLLRLRHQPELLESGTAVEELLRFTSPVQVSTERYALEDVEMSGATIPSGALVLAVVGSANRDERQFVNPDKLDLGRTPNPHLAFGQGAHYCLGAPWPGSKVRSLSPPSSGAWPTCAWPFPLATFPGAAASSSAASTHCR